MLKVRFIFWTLLRIPSFKFWSLRGSDVSPKENEQDLLREPDELILEHARTLASQQTFPVGNPRIVAKGLLVWS